MSTIKKCTKNKDKCSRDRYNVIGIHIYPQERLSYKYWNDSTLESTMRKLVVRIIYEECQRSGKLILCIVDDTISSKTVPSSKTVHPIEEALFHFSHLKKKQDY